MKFQGSAILPAIRTMKHYERLLASSYEHAVLLDAHVAQLKPLFAMAGQRGKKLFLHADLIHGLKNDDYAVEYVCQEFRPFGLISTKASVIVKAKQKGVLAIQRMFLLDSGALRKSYALVQKTEPDYIEVLPGILPEMIAEVRLETGIPIFAGGLIRSQDEVERALAAGATAVTTSDMALWTRYENK